MEKGEVVLDYREESLLRGDGAVRGGGDPPERARPHPRPLRPRLRRRCRRLRRGRGRRGPSHLLGCHPGRPGDGSEARTRPDVTRVSPTLPPRLMLCSLETSGLLVLSATPRVSCRNRVVFAVFLKGRKETETRALVRRSPPRAADRSAHLQRQPNSLLLPPSM